MEIIVFPFLIMLFAVYAWGKKDALVYVSTITFFTILFICILQTIIMSIRDLDFSIEWLGYTFFYTFIILACPILFSVIIFKYFYKRYFLFKNIAIKSSAGFLFLFFIIQGCLICWTILDMQFLDFDYEYTFDNIAKTYKSNYLDFLPISLLIPFWIIYLDKRYDRRLLAGKGNIEKNVENKF